MSHLLRFKTILERDTRPVFAGFYLKVLFPFAAYGKIPEKFVSECKITTDPELFRIGTMNERQLASLITASGPNPMQTWLIEALISRMKYLGLIYSIPGHDLIQFSKGTIEYMELSSNIVDSMLGSYFVTNKARLSMVSIEVELDNGHLSIGSGFLLRPPNVSVGHGLIPRYLVSARHCVSGNVRKIISIKDFGGEPVYMLRR